MPKRLEIRWVDVPQEELDNEIGKLRRNGQIFPPATCLTLQRLPFDFVERCHWADPNKTTEDDCIVFFYQDGRDPRENEKPTYPTYHGQNAKRFVMLYEAQAAGMPEEIAKRQVLTGSEKTCWEKYCVNRKHLWWGGPIRNRFTQS